MAQQTDVNNHTSYKGEKLTEDEEKVISHMYFNEDLVLSIYDMFYHIGLMFPKGYMSPEDVDIVFSNLINQGYVEGNSTSIIGYTLSGKGIDYYMEHLT